MVRSFLLNRLTGAEATSGGHRPTLPAASTLDAGNLRLAGGRSQDPAAPVSSQRHGSLSPRAQGPGVSRKNRASRGKPTRCAWSQGRDLLSVGGGVLIRIKEIPA